VKCFAPRLFDGKRWNIMGDECTSSHGLELLNVIHRSLFELAELCATLQIWVE
jgi:hypothetical protein